MNNPLKSAADKLAQAVREMTDVWTGSLDYGKYYTATIEALKAYEAAVAADAAKPKHSECLFGEDCDKPRFEDFDYCVDHLLEAHSRGEGDISDSDLKRIKQAKADAAQPEKPGAGWIENMVRAILEEGLDLDTVEPEEVDELVKRCVPLYAKHAPAPQPVAQAEAEAEEDLFGFAPFRKWFDNIWPEPKHSPKNGHGKYSNWKYRMQTAWSGWEACERFGKHADRIQNLEISLGLEMAKAEAQKPVAADWMHEAADEIVDYSGVPPSDAINDIASIIAKHAPAQDSRDGAITAQELIEWVVKHSLAPDNSIRFKCIYEEDIGQMRGYLKAMQAERAAMAAEPKWTKP